MTRLKARKVKNSLKSKGFKQSNSNHKIYIFYYRGQKTSILTLMSHSSREIGDFHIRHMKEQLHLSKQEFVDLVRCQVTESNLIDKYMREGYLKQA